MKRDLTTLKTIYFAKIDGGGSIGGEPEVRVVPTVVARFKLRVHALSLSLSRDRFERSSEPWSTSSSAHVS
jgi:hypothetical protein